jgi:hypothetical protein
LRRESLDKPEFFEVLGFANLCMCSRGQRPDCPLRPIQRAPQYVQFQGPTHVMTVLRLRKKFLHANIIKRTCQAL